MAANEVCGPREGGSRIPDPSWLSPVSPSPAPLSQEALAVVLGDVQSHMGCRERNCQLREGGSGCANPNWGVYVCAQCMLYANQAQRSQEINLMETTLQKETERISFLFFFLNVFEDNLGAILAPVWG